MAVDEAKACVLAARNLALAEKQGNRPIMAPCAACYLVLNKTKHYFHDYPAMKETMDRALGAVGLRYSGDTPVRHPLDVLINDVGLEAIKQKVRKPLKGLKIATYYGCQLVRPYATFDDQYNPTTMDRLVEALGATVVRYPLKTKCCGGSLTGTVPEAGIRLVYILLNEAKKRGADCLATVCPLCQFNLDAYHAQVTAEVRAGAGADRLFHATHGPGLWPARAGAGSEPGRHSVQVAADRSAAGQGGRGGLRGVHQPKLETKEVRTLKS